MPSEASAIFGSDQNGIPFRSSMIPLNDRLKTVHGQVASLVQEHLALRRRVTELEQAGREHDRLREVLSSRVSELERENEVLRTSRPAAVATGIPGTKERIDELVDEIDRCLAMIQG
jgi:uncharacterized protein YicC (UPF0701 family)